MNNNFAFYFMQDNKYLGDVLAIDYVIDDKSASQKGYTSNNIMLLVKYSQKPPETTQHFDLLKFISECFDTTQDILLRMGSECMYGMYGDSHCDCEDQRLNALEAINLAGQGIYIHLPQEAQGRGLFYKTKELELQVGGRLQTGEYIGEKSIEEAYKHILGSDEKLDIRDYSYLKFIFRELGLNIYTYTLLTSNKQKADYLRKELGITLSKIQDVHRHLTIHNITEVLGKLYQKNNYVSAEELDNMYAIVANAPFLPLRLVNIVNFIAEDLTNKNIFNTDVSKLTKLIELVRQKSPSSSQISIHNSLPIADITGDDEHEYSYKVSDDIFEYLFKIFNKNYINYTAFEVSRHYDTVGTAIIDKSGRELKIRTSFNIYGMSTDITTRMIYKTRVAENHYRTVNKELRGGLDLEFMNANPLYIQTKEQDVITHVCELTESANLLIKLYPGTGRFLELKGPKKLLEPFVQKLEKYQPLKDESLKLLLQGVGIVNKFPESAKQQLLLNERALGKKYNIKNNSHNLRFKMFS